MKGEVWVGEELAAEATLLSSIGKQPLGPEECFVNSEW
jgi:hypothetical protein